MGVARLSRHIHSGTPQVFSSTTHHHSNVSQIGNVLAVAGVCVLGLSGCWWVTASYSTRLDTTTAPQKRPLRLARDARQPHTIFVWDFDWTVINCNSDEYIPAQFLGAEKTNTGFRELRKAGKDWHACVEGMVNQSMEDASPEHILDAARQMPYLTGVRGALDAINNKRRQDGSTGQIILSDGNTLFIGAFVHKNGLAEHFSHGIISNEGRWIDQRLCVVHQSQQYGGHDCERCSANLCKTQALQKTLVQWFPHLQAQEMDNEDTTVNAATNHRHAMGIPRIVYVGDGANDACPVLNVLGEGDVMLARVGKKRRFANGRKGAETDEEAAHSTDGDAKEGSPFGIVPALARAKEGDPSIVPKCQVLEWKTGDELRSLVEMLLKDIE